MLRYDIYDMIYDVIYDMTCDMIYGMMICYDII